MQKVEYQDLSNVRELELDHNFLNEIDPLNRNLTNNEFYEKAITKTKYQLMGIISALNLNSLSELENKIILDAPCGSMNADGYGILFEPWLGRALEHYKVQVTGIDFGFQYSTLKDGKSQCIELFPIHKIDMCFGTFPVNDSTYNLINIYNFLGSPSFDDNLDSKSNDIKQHVYSESNRILKPDGILLLNEY